MRLLLVPRMTWRNLSKIVQRRDINIDQQSRTGPINNMSALREYVRKLFSKPNLFNHYFDAKFLQNL